MNLTEKRQKIIELIMDELNFKTMVHPLRNEVGLSPADFIDLKISSGEADKILNKLKDEKMITSYILGSYKRNIVNWDRIIIFLDNQKFYKALNLTKLEFDKNGLLRYGTTVLKFQKGSDQYKLLELLFENIGTVVSFKEITKILWQKEDSKPEHKRIRDLASKILKKLRDKKIDTHSFETNGGYGIIQ